LFKQSLGKDLLVFTWDLLGLESELTELNVCLDLCLVTHLKGPADVTVGISLSAEPQFERHDFSAGAAAWREPAMPCLPHGGHVGEMPHL